MLLEWDLLLQAEPLERELTVVGFHNEIQIGISKIKSKWGVFKNEIQMRDF